MPKITMEFEFSSEVEMEITEDELQDIQNGGWNDKEELVEKYEMLYEAKLQSELTSLYFRVKEEK